MGMSPLSDDDADSPDVLQEEDLPPLSIEIKGPSSLGEKAVVAAEDIVCDGIHLRPYGCSLGAKGRFAEAIGQSASGVWMGRSTRSTGSSAGEVAGVAGKVAPALANMVTLDCCDVMASGCLAAPSLLRFLADAGD